jgi:uncharacterized protein (TIGR03085 family)
VAALRATDLGSIRRVTAFASIERAALVDLMAELGPDAPTLCTGWTTRDLAAHLVVRLSRVDAAAGIVVKGLAEHTRRVQDRVAGQDWPVLLSKVRRRPWWLIGDEAVNRVEYFVHHEDVRRAQPGWQPRKLDPNLVEALWSRVRGQARLVLRRTPATVTVTAPGHGTVTAGRGGGRGGAMVDLLGPPAELLLFLMGRQGHAQVELAGPAEITDRMRGARYGV